MSDPNVTVPARDKDKRDRRKQQEYEDAVGRDEHGAFTTYHKRDGKRRNEDQTNESEQPDDDEPSK